MFTVEWEGSPTEIEVKSFGLAEKARTHICHVVLIVTASLAFSQMLWTTKAKFALRATDVQHDFSFKPLTGRCLVLLVVEVETPWESCHCPSRGVPVPSLGDRFVCKQAESKGRSRGALLQKTVVSSFGRSCFDN